MVGSDADVFVVRRTRNEQRGGRRMKGEKGKEGEEEVGDEEGDEDGNGPG